eukprot:TRINITY_DN48252_c0_g1_i1.p1 TRINITY_DN48252_c0_g1~~TRINITY_DN48252_c0_g1_i1.p1  ORF type:complete len:161 (-),score=4.24 TRINITY_DN48252_c0_g1_i1:35-517(-)
MMKRAVPNERKHAQTFHHWRSSLVPRKMGVCGHFAALCPRMSKILMAQETRQCFRVMSKASRVSNSVSPSELKRALTSATRGVRAASSESRVDAQDALTAHEHARKCDRPLLRSNYFIATSSLSHFEASNLVSIRESRNHKASRAALYRFSLSRYGSLKR